ncbi:MAG: response regulator transcription factor, partial [Acidimicrobiales bacterium]
MTGDGTTTGRAVSLVMVDDHTMFIQSLAKLLSLEPLLSVVALAGTAAGGLEAVRRHAPSVVLMDN